MNTNDSRIVETANQLLRWLVASDFSTVERYTHGVRLSAKLLREAILDYGKTLVMPTALTLEELDVIEIEGASPKAWSVRVNLWTLEEGRSDLTLECTFFDGMNKTLAVEIDNLHVL